MRVARSLTTGHDVAELLSALASDCARLLDVASAGILLADSAGVLHVMAASNEGTRDLEVLQLQREQGPCLDCHRHGRPVSVADLSDEKARWPLFVPAARSAGFASVHALPLQVAQRTLGVLGRFGTAAGALNDDDLSLAQALAGVALVHDRTRAQIPTTDWLETALSTRVVLEQAKGVIAHRGGLDMLQAFDALRRYAHDHDERLTAVARAVVSRALDPAEVLEHDRRARAFER